MADSYPIGAVVAFAGDKLPKANSGGWLACDGSNYPPADDDYKTLFGVIDFIYGKDPTTGNFLVPDYRGQFLRGTDARSNNDPDAHLRRRHADLYPRADGSFAAPVGDQVGTVQEDALGRPKKAFTANLSNLPQSAKSTAYTIGSPPHAASWKGGSTEVTMPVSGGDSESRPVNVCVQYFIKYSMGS